ncbi:hypothetical protein [Rossellomorea vietnamensis]|uniref:hypothetical protein n=1 Tax=Rossellomorea vietnamensis TaxID=218284 RepID=UPI00077C8EDC|nr:hypothetical protein [Rossellomorea vietnamensis]
MWLINYFSLSSINKPVILYEIPIYIIFTVLGTFLAAILAQIISHYLTNKREKKKEFMQKYQDLYVNIIAPISTYMHIKTNPRKLHDVHHNVIEGDLLEIALSELKEKIKYASPTVLKVYEGLIGYEYYEDGWGSRAEIDKHAIVYFLLDDIIRTSKRTGVFSRSDRKRLIQLKYYYGLFACALSFFEMREAEVIIQMENFSGVRKKVKYKELRKELLSFDRNSMKKHLIKHLKLVQSSNKDMYSSYIEELSSFSK